jgi:carbon-monoxide dehydrogenase large subunit
VSTACAEPAPCWWTASPFEVACYWPVQADGRDVETVESLAPDPAHLNPLQVEFVRHHGVQCGFCTGGILMSLTAALRHNPQPTEAEVRETLAGHLCRCTGYQGMVDAVLALVASRRVAPDAKSSVDLSAAPAPLGGPTAVRTPEGGCIGAPIPRREDARLLTGRGTFVDDLEMPGVAHAAMLRSPHAHARVRRIDVTAALALPGVLAVITADDIADIQKPWPARMPSPVPGTAVRHGVRHTLPRDKVRHAGEVVAAVVAESRALAEDAATPSPWSTTCCPSWPRPPRGWHPARRSSTTSSATTSRRTSSSAWDTTSAPSRRPITRSARRSG